MKRILLILMGLMLLKVGALADSNPQFTVQYYGQLTVAAPQGETPLTLIDTSGANLPVNNTKDLPTRQVYLGGQGGRILTKSSLQKLYKDQTFQFYNAPELSYFDQLSAQNPNYRLAALWVWQGSGSPESVDPAQWQIYEDPWALTFTSDPEAAQGRVLVKEGTVLRLVYEPTQDVYENAVTFYDYDITDGSTYADAAYTQPIDRTSNRTLYVKTGREGINSAANVNGSALPALGFGNKNTGTQIGQAAWEGNTLNCNDGDNFKGCTFGIVTGLDEQGLPRFAQGIAAPALFGSAPAAGKTVLTGYTLGFQRLGDSYTLTSVSQGGQRVLSGLDAFSNPAAAHTGIWTNHFWPLDRAATANGAGHDITFGSSERLLLRKFGSGKYQALPQADDDKDHNSYFGMSYTVNFTLTPDYQGPLEYMFFGDDDMWAFLDGQLICDLGGVHSSVGEYVNLWDYISQTGRTQAREHTLSFFYTERGASGSTCYMSFTLPSVNYQTDLKETGSLAIAKRLQGEETGEKAFNFILTLSDRGVTGKFGDIAFQRGVAQFQLRAGESLTASGLPAGITYAVTEAQSSGYTVLSTGAEGIIQAGGTAIATFTNTAVTPTPEPTATPTPVPTATSSPGLQVTPPPSLTPSPAVSPEPTPGPVDFPQTGDENHPLLWLMVLATGAGILWVYKKKGLR